MEMTDEKMAETNWDSQIILAIHGDCWEMWGAWNYEQEYIYIEESWSQN
jgi:hypothetical protein